MPSHRIPGFYRTPLFFALVFAISSLASLALVAESAKAESPATSVTVSSNSSSASAAIAPRFDCCDLLTPEEIEAVQKSPIRDKKNSERANGGLLNTQCVYVAADYAKSVSLTVSHADPADATKGSVTTYWKESFGRYSEPAETPEPDQHSAGSANAEKESAPPTKVEGIGDDAYWLADRVGGALYVLKKDAILRLSLGGKQTEETRLENSKVLAKKALARL